MRVHVTVYLCVFVLLSSECNARIIFRHENAFILFHCPFIQIRNRNFEGNVSFKGCQQSSPTLVQTPSAYAWVKFYSNHQTVNQGFNVTWSVVNTGVTSATFKRS